MTACGACEHCGEIRYGRVFVASKEHGDYRMEILTVTELAAMLKMSMGQIYEMTRARTRDGEMRDHPLPVLRINGNLRFRKSDIESWLEKLVANGE